MYAYLDRPVATLPAADRLVLDAMRGWAFARTMGRDPHASLAARLPELERTGALDLIDAAMTLLDRGSDDALAFQRPCVDTVEETEAVLLAVAADARGGALDAAVETLALLVDRASARRVALLLADLGRRTAAVVSRS